MISAPLIAGVAKDAGKPADLSAAGFPGTGPVDFKTVVDRVFAGDETVAEAVGRKGHGVKQSDKPVKEKVEADASGMPFAVPVMLQENVPPMNAEPGATPGAEALFGTSGLNAALKRCSTQNQNLAGSDVVGLPANSYPSAAGQNASLDAAMPEEMQPVAATVQADTSSEEKVAPARANARVESSHRVNSQVWQPVASEEAFEQESVVTATSEAEKQLSDQGEASIAVTPAAGRTDMTDSAKQSATRRDQTIETEVAHAGAEAPAASQIHEPSPKTLKHASRTVERPATFKPVDTRNEIAAQDDQAGVAEKSNTTNGSAPSPSVVHTSAHVLANEAKATQLPREASGSPDVKSEAVLAHAAVNDTATSTVPAIQVEGGKARNDVHPEVNMKPKVRREGKETAVADPASPNSQAKAVETGAEVLGGVLHKNSAGHALHDHSNLPTTHQTNDPTAPTFDDGADEALPSLHTLVNTAKLVHDLSQAEMRVGMQSREFGNVDIRTSVARHVFSAQISVEHSDVARNLSSDLPALMDRLAEQQVLVGNIQVHNSGLSTSSGLAQDGQAQSWRPQAASFGTKPDMGVIPAAVFEAVNGNGRLDIRV